MPAQTFPSKPIPLQNVVATFVERGTVRNRDLFEQLSLDLGLTEHQAKTRAPVGKSGAVHNLFERSVRWHCQTLRRLGIIERIDRGVWALTDKARKDLTVAPRKSVMLAFSTELGCALWGNAEDVFSGLGEDITLAFTSPPYPLAIQRQYGNVDQTEYVDWLCGVMEPVIKHLRPGGNLVLNLTNDCFEPQSPSRSLYLERLTLALCDRFGLKLMDRMVWLNPQKPPGPIQWASKARVQCNVQYEHCLWFTNDPSCVIADNRRVLRPHTESHLKLIQRGGETRSASNSGGAYVIRPGSYSAPTAGAIPRNVLNIPHRDASQKPARDFAKAHGLPVHPATMPSRLAEFFVEFLSEINDLVVDPFGGMATTGKAAENKGRRWLLTERCREYLLSASQRFTGCKGFSESFAN